MEEQTAEELQNAETAEEAADETAHAEETVETTDDADAPDKAENELVRLKGKIVHADEELETEFGEEEGDIWHEMEEVHGVAKHKASEAKAAGEFEYVRKQKPVPKIRRVDMSIHYPDESESSMDEKKVEKKAVEAEAEGFGPDFDDSEYLIDPNKDYSLVDPSFLDEFLSSEEEQYYEAGKLEVERRGEAFEEVEEEEDDFQQEIYIQPPDREPSDRVYDQICDLETPVSSDESFKVSRFRFIPRRRSYPTQGDFREEDNKWLSQTQSVHSNEVPSTALLNLMENIAPALKKTLMEIATYQPSNAVYYMTHSLLHKAKDHEEVGLEPDPHLIQMIVDGQKKKKKQQLIPIIKKTDEMFMLPHAESHISTPQKEVKPDVPITDDDDDDDEDPSQLHRFQRKYRKAKKKEVTEEKAKRTNLSRKAMLPGICLGPTSLPLIADTPSKIKPGSSKA